MSGYHSSMANSEAHRPHEPVIDDQLTLIFDVHINKKVVYDLSSCCGGVGQSINFIISVKTILKHATGGCMTYFHKEILKYSCVS